MRKPSSAVLVVVSLVVGAVVLPSVSVEADPGPSVVDVIAVGEQPWGVAFSPDGTLAYVGNSGSNSISIIDIAERNAQTIAVPNPDTGEFFPSSPAGVVVTPDEKAIFTAYQALTTFSSSSSGSIATAPASLGCLNPLAITLHGNGLTAYVACGDGRIMTVSASDLTSEVLAAENGSVDDIAYVPQGSKPSDALASLRNHPTDGTGDFRLSTSDARQPLAGFGLSLAVDATGTFAYVGDSNGVLSAFDIASHPAAPVFTVEVEAGKGLRGIALSPDGKRAYVTIKSSNAVAVVDLVARAVVSTIAVGAGPQRIAVSPDGRTVLVTNNESNTVSVIDIPQLPQGAITFTSSAPSPAVVGDLGYIPTFSGGSGTGAFVLTSSSPEVCSAGLSGGAWQVQHLAAGTCMLSVLRAADGTFAASGSVLQSYAVTSAGVTIPDETPSGSPLGLTASRAGSEVTLAWTLPDDPRAVFVSVCAIEPAADDDDPEVCASVASWIDPAVAEAFGPLPGIFADLLLPTAPAELVVTSGVSPVAVAIETGGDDEWVRGILGCGSFAFQVAGVQVADLDAGDDDLLYPSFASTVEVEIPCPDGVTAEWWAPFLQGIPVALSATPEGSGLRVAWDAPAGWTVDVLEVYVARPDGDLGSALLVTAWLSDDVMTRPGSESIPPEVAEILIPGDVAPTSVSLNAGTTRTVGFIWDEDDPEGGEFVLGVLGCGPMQVFLEGLDLSRDLGLFGGIEVDLPCPDPASEPTDGETTDGPGPTGDTEPDVGIGGPRGVSEPTRTVTCSPEVPRVGANVTCRLAGGAGGSQVKWRASYNPTFAGATIVLDADGAGTFAFVVPAAALGSPLVVEVVGWGDPMVLVKAVPVPIPRGIPAGGGASSLRASATATGGLAMLLAVLLHLSVRRPRSPLGRAPRLSVPRT